MIPWELLASASTPDGGELSLHRRGGEFSIRIDRRELMNSRQHGSEEAMAHLAAAALAAGPRPSALVGGLGMGFTLAATLAALPPGARIDVAELVPAVVAWNRGPLGPLAGAPLNDPRVRVCLGDVHRLLQDRPSRYDLVLLDVDNGPEGLTAASNQALYGRRGLVDIARSLRPRGVLSVWSRFDDPAFTARLRAAGFRPETHRVRARANGKGARHTIWVAARS